MYTQSMSNTEIQAMTLVKQIEWALVRLTEGGGCSLEEAEQISRSLGLSGKLPEALIFRDQESYENGSEGHVEVSDFTSFLCRQLTIPAPGSKFVDDRFTCKANASAIRQAYISWGLLEAPASC